MSDEYDASSDVEIKSEAECYLIRPSVVSPIVLTGLLVWAAFELSPWALLGIPFAVLGTICGQPDGNLGDGCFAVLCGVAGLLIFAFLHQDIGMLIFASSMGGFFAGVIEKRITALPHDPSLASPDE